MTTRPQATHPGRVLHDEVMKPLGISRNKLARDIDVPVGRISAIVSGTRAVTADTALRLAKYFGTTPELWLKLQSDYDLAVARTTVWPRIDPRVRVLDEPAPIAGAPPAMAPEASEPVADEVPSPAPGTVEPVAAEPSVPSEPAMEAEPAAEGLSVAPAPAEEPSPGPVEPVSPESEAVAPDADKPLSMAPPSEEPAAEPEPEWIEPQALSIGPVPGPDEQSEAPEPMAREPDAA
jgi:addiction module HigA family antidote